MWYRTQLVWRTALVQVGLCSNLQYLLWLWDDSTIGYQIDWKKTNKKKNVLPDPENQDLLKLKSAQISQNKPMDPVCLRTDGIWLITQSETLHLKYWHTEEPMGSKQVNNNNNNNNNNISIACCIKRCVVVHYSFHPLYVFLRVNNKITILLSG